MTKERLTVSVDPELAAAGAAAVAAGRAESLSAWVSEAIADRAAKDLRLAALSAAVTAYEDEHGIIDDDELAEQVRSDRDAAAGVRSGMQRQGAA